MTARPCPAWAVRPWLPLLGLCFLLASCRPGEDADGPIRPELCGGRADLISSIQGSARRSPRVGELVTVEAVLIGEFIEGLGGLFLQEEQVDRDGDPMTSEGIFIQIDGSRPKIEIGDVLRVQGRVAELGEGRHTLTALTEISGFKVCGKADELPQAALIEEAPLVATDWEAYEAMRVEIEPGARVIANHRLLTQGELLVGLLGRQWTPTDRHPPGEAARAMWQDNERARILLDDGRVEAPPGERVSYLPVQPGIDAPWRVGTEVSQILGILDHRAGSYRLHPLAAIKASQQSRPERVPEVRGGLRIAVFNVENYFNGDGDGGGFPTPRGASSQEELNRQRAKLMSTLKALDADLYALIEVENDGYERESAIADLTRRLNQSRGRPNEYDYIRAPGERLGSDDIAVGILYRPRKLAPLGEAATLARGPYRNWSRQPLAQTFESKANQGRFTVVVNHWKSKGGCQDAPEAQRDQGDGQGCWNAARVQSARLLADWLATDPTASGDPDLLILGDLNAYAQEDPLRLLREAGYVALAPANPETHYTYVFNGMSGNLDHALASPGLAEQVRGMAIWHINADELGEFNYQRGNKSRTQEARMFRSDPFRSSDHDPILLGIDLDPPPPPEPEAENDGKP